MSNSYSDSTFIFAACPQSEGPAAASSSEPEKPSMELTDEQKAEVSSYLNEILNSTSTIEAQAKAKGQEWKNYGRQFYQEQTGASDMEMQVLTKAIWIFLILHRLGPGWILPLGVRFHGQAIRRSHCL